MNLFRKQKQLKKKKIVKNKLKKCKDKRKLSPLQLLKIEFFNNNVSFPIFDHFSSVKNSISHQNYLFFEPKFDFKPETRFKARYSTSEQNSSSDRKAFLDRNSSFFQFWIKIFGSIKCISVTVIL